MCGNSRAEIEAAGSTEVYWDYCQCKMMLSKKSILNGQQLTSRVRLNLAQ